MLINHVKEKKPHLKVNYSVLIARALTVFNFLMKDEPNIANRDVLKIDDKLLEQVFDLTNKDQRSCHQIIAGVLFAKNYDQAQLEMILDKAMEWYKSDTVPCYMLKLAMLTNKIEIYKALVKDRKVDFDKCQFGDEIHEIFEMFLKNRPKFKKNLFTTVHEKVVHFSPFKILKMVFADEINANLFLNEVLALPGILEDAKE